MLLISISVSSGVVSDSADTVSETTRLRHHVSSAVFQTPLIRVLLIYDSGGGGGAYGIDV
jgi:hypothetical protein